MRVGVFLSIGDSLSNMERTGQLSKYLNAYLRHYSDNFEEVVIFSYENESISNLPKNVTLIGKKSSLHRYLYAILMPFLHKNEISTLDVIRAYHLLGTVPAIVSKLFFGKPFVFNFAYDYFKFALIDKKYLQSLLILLVHPLAIYLSDRVFVGSRSLCKRYKLKKVVFLPNGVDLVKFHPGSKLRKTVKKMLTVGRLEPQKNHLELLMAIAGLPIELTIVGKGKLKKKILARAAQLNVKLSLVDRIDNKNLPNTYKKADIFILPSLLEGHPKVLLEAMACGLPVIGSNVEGINEIICDGKTGLLSGTNYDSIRAKALLLIDSDQLRYQLAVNARKEVAKKYDISKLIRLEIDTIKKI